MTEFFGENHCSRNDGTRQRATARLVNSGDPRDSDGAEFFLVTKSAAPIGHRQKLSADCADFHRFFRKRKSPVELGTNLRDLWTKKISVTPAQPSLPCLCECG